MTTLVTGASGFIGMYVCQKLPDRGETVRGLGSLNDYYDVKLKEARLVLFCSRLGFSFEKLDLAEMSAVAYIFARSMNRRVVHLAAKTGVRYSISDPHAYGNANLVSVLNILEVCRYSRVEHLVYASRSSVYGGNRKRQFSEIDAVDHPISLYAATKKAYELMAHSYSHLYGLPTTGLRFFTVYGPWGRPDMSPILFARAIFEGQPIDFINHGKMQCDLTYIDDDDDDVDGVVRVLGRPATVRLDYEAMHPVRRPAMCRDASLTSAITSRQSRSTTSVLWSARSASRPLRTSIRCTLAICSPPC